MVTCRAEAGLRVPLSIPSWLSSNIAELRRTATENVSGRGAKEQRNMVVGGGTPHTCHMRSDVHPGPWPSPERREQHGTPLHCEAWALFRIHSPVEAKGHGAHERRNLLGVHPRVQAGSSQWEFSLKSKCVDQQLQNDAGHEKQKKNATTCIYSSR